VLWDYSHLIPTTGNYVSQTIIRFFLLEGTRACLCVYVYMYIYVYI